MALRIACDYPAVKVFNICDAEHAQRINAWLGS